jgi:hypothetical protein
VLTTLVNGQVDVLGGSAVVFSSAEIDAFELDRLIRHDQRTAARPI